MPSTTSLIKNYFLFHGPCINLALVLALLEFSCIKILELEATLMLTPRVDFHVFETIFSNESTWASL